MPIVEEFKPDLVIISQVPDQEIYKSNYNYICICFLIPGLRRTERWPMPGRIWADACHLWLHDKGNAAKNVAFLSNWLSLSVWWAWQTEGFSPCLREDTSLTRFASFLCFHLFQWRPHLRLMQPGRHRRSRFSSCLGPAWWPPGWHQVSITQTPYQKMFFFLTASTNSLSSLSCFRFSTTPSKAALEAVMNTASAHKEGWECMKELVKSFPTQWEISQNEPNSALPRQWSAPLKYP